MLEGDFGKRTKSRYLVMSADDVEAMRSRFLLRARIKTSLLRLAKELVRVFSGIDLTFVSCKLSKSCRERKLGSKTNFGKYFIPKVGLDKTHQVFSEIVGLMLCVTVMHIRQDHKLQMPSNLQELIRIKRI